MVKREQTALFFFFFYSQIGATVCLFTSFVIAEVGFRQELMLVRTLVLKLFACKHVLLVGGIAFALGLTDSGEELGELIVAVNVGGVFLDWIFHAQYG